MYCNVYWTIDTTRVLTLKDTFKLVNSEEERNDASQHLRRHCLSKGPQALHS